ncbi:MaoC family dehydratase [Nocardioides zeae]
MRTFTSLDEVAAAAGEDLGVSDWVEIDQERVDTFAEATGDHQWIHVDAERAAEGPFGGTIAHGYLTLSLVPMLGASVVAFDTPGAKLNYGVNKVRFPSRCSSASACARTSRSATSPTCRPASRHTCATRSRSRARRSPPASRRRSSCCWPEPRPRVVVGALHLPRVSHHDPGWGARQVRRCGR